MGRLYGQREISRVLAISEGRVRHWSRIGLVPPREKERGQLFFDFQGLVALRTVKKLADQKISLRKIRRCLEKMKILLPHVTQPLAELQIYARGREIVLGHQNRKFTPEGQLLMDFAPDSSSLIPLPVEAVDELFFQGLECEQEGRTGEARKKYEMVLALRPDHVNALVNLGNMMYRAGSEWSAEGFYRQALVIDPDHVEANFNLGNLFMEKNDLDNALLFYRKALHEDPAFADAHFNLARVLEKFGDREGMREHWLRYLDLDPASEWARYIRERLQEDQNPRSKDQN